MKKIKFLLVALLSITLFNCGDDDSPSAELTSDSIAGSFNIVLYEGSTEETTTSTSGNDSVVETTTFNGDTFTNANFTFNTSGTYASSGEYRENITVTNSSGTTTNASIEDFIDSGSFSVNTTSRTLTLDGEIYDVTLFDGTNLYFENEASFIAGNGNTITEIERFRLVKIN